MKGLKYPGYIPVPDEITRNRVKSFLLKNNIHLSGILVVGGGLSIYDKNTAWANNCPTIDDINRQRFQTVNTTERTLWDLDNLMPNVHKELCL